MRFSAALSAVLVVGCAKPVPVAQAPTPPADSTVVTPPRAQTVTVAAKKGRTYANIRFFADGKSAVMTRVDVGTVLKTFGRDGDWFQVQVPATGALGWIHAVYLDE